MKDMNGMKGMNVTIIGEPRFYLETDLATAKALMKLSESHYCASCRVAGKVGGFLYAWTTLLEILQLSQADDPELATGQRAKPSATFRELDLTLKLIEGAHLVLGAEDRALVYRYEYGVRAAMARANKINDWRIEL